MKVNTTEAKYVKIKFNSKPDDEVIGKIKEAGFKWDSKNQLWYASNEDDIAIKFGSKPDDAVLGTLKDSGFKWDISKKAWCIKGSAGNSSRSKSVTKTSAESGKLCCYVNSLNGFWEESSKASWLNKMKTAYKKNVAYDLSDEQIKAWEDCFDAMRELKKRCSANSKFGKYGYFSIIFEYLIPSQRGNNRGYGIRPDVLLLCDNCVLVLEFKTGTGNLDEKAEQVLKYAEYLENHHTGCKDKEVIPMLVFTGMKQTKGKLEVESKEVLMCPASLLADEIEEYAPGFVKKTDPEKWMNAKFN